MPDGSSPTITEGGDIYNPLFGVLARFVFSPALTMDTYQADLRKRLQAQPRQ